MAVTGIYFPQYTSEHRCILAKTGTYCQGHVMIHLHKYYYVPELEKVCLNLKKCA